MSEIEFIKIFTKNLNKYLELSGKTQAELSRDLNISKTTVSSWFNGKRIPRMDKIDMLCEYFGINRSDLMEDKTDSEPSYYLNDETKQIAQEIYENPDLRILFDASKNASPEDLKFVIEMVKRMKGDN
ncbi:MAG: helix-turn-helix transcriptional regulator [Anaerostipes sp.]|nr:helix-turn-helix transcriptional regulator [Anaerostipes sp.]